MKGNNMANLVYNDPLSRLKNEDEAARDKEAKRLKPLYDRHAQEKGDMERSHYTESRQLDHEFRDIHQAVRRPNVEEKRAKAFHEMEKRHKAEREKLAEKHSSELRAAKAKRA
jgi:hypothetical protein